MRTSTMTRARLLICMTFAFCIVLLGIPISTTQAATWEQIQEKSNVQGGLIIHIGCGDGSLTAALGTGGAYIVQGLDADAENVAAARAHIKSKGRYGNVSADVFDGRHLPYIDNLVNLLVAEKLGAVTMDEVMRVLVPGAVACIKRDGKWTRHVKPWPKDIDEWTHYLHDATGNAVAHDTVVGPPRRLQWVGSPRWGRHHDHMSSVSAVVTSGGRLFYIVDEAPRFSILVAPQWKLVARDAFNGTILWKRSIDQWYNHLHPLKSGPAQLPRRLVAQGDRVYVTLGLDGPVTALDAATGQTVATYEGTAGTDEILLSDGIILALIGGESAPSATAQSKRENLKDPSGESDGKLIALRAESGEILWTSPHAVVKLALAMDSKRVVLLSADRILCLNKSSGELMWRSEPLARAEKFPVRSGPTLVLYDDVVLFAGSELAAEDNRTWKVNQNDTLTALSIKDGTVLWKAPHPLSGYASPEDVLVAGGRVWIGETTSGHAVGKFVARDIYTGEVVSEFDPDVETYWFHHRCYRGKATDRFLLMSRTGTEFIDFKQQHWDINHWVRGACLYGVMPANGLIYAPQNPCACFPEAKQYGLNALAPAKGPRIGASAARIARLQKGPAYDQIDNSQSTIVNPKDWPTYRHDNARSGRTNASVRSALTSTWKTNVGGNLTSPVVAGGKVFVASKDTHTVHALDARSGKALWSYTAGARVDSPPTIFHQMVLFGSADGYVYNLRASDGALAWRFRAAPMDQRAMWFEQLESVWPVHGSVLVQGGVVYCVAGRSAFLDDGMRLIRLDPATGRLLSETVLNDQDPAAGKAIQDYARQHNMPVSLPDILSCDGRLVYMRSQPFDLEGKRLALEALPYAGNPEKYSIPSTQQPEHAHLFCPTGFLDDSWWHRTYWVYGSRFLGGWAGYPQAGKVAPSGKILVFDKENVYGYGRQPQYYRWTTPIEHHLFSAAKDPSAVEQERPERPRQEKRNQQKGFKVFHRWTKDIPLFARALVMADRTLFVAGPADIIDENEIRKRLDTPEAARQLREQVAAFVGKKGAMLWAVSAANGQKQAELALDELPVFDGMAAAYGRLFLTTVDGNVQCLGEDR
ncbi:MAG: PQQ-binding-like beta-propeller repeat protein [Phycisphaerae bacterium]|nr:PQQ-binding-like beta-propeller repeat protein [Phycisphaerae bacterium]